VDIPVGHIKSKSLKILKENDIKTTDEKSVNLTAYAFFPRCEYHGCLRVAWKECALLFIRRKNGGFFMLFKKI